MIPVAGAVTNGGEKVPDHFTPLSSTDVHCATLWFTTVHCGSQQLAIVHYNLHFKPLSSPDVHWVTPYIALCCIIPHCGSLWFTIIYYGSLWCTTAWYFMAHTVVQKVLWYKKYGTLHRGFLWCTQENSLVHSSTL